MITLAPRTCKSILKGILILLAAFCAGAATAAVAALPGCNMVTRAAVGAGQGLVDDCRSAYRHGNDQLRNAERDTRHEEAALQGGQEGGGR